MSLLVSPKEGDDLDSANKNHFLFSPDLIDKTRDDINQLDNTDTIMRKIPPHLTRQYEAFRQQSSPMQIIGDQSGVQFGDKSSGLMPTYAQKSDNTFVKMIKNQQYNFSGDLPRDDTAGRSMFEKSELVAG